MKMVTLTRDMKPWRAGESYAVPDEMAQRLVKSGEAKDERTFPPPDVSPPTQTASPLQPKTYMTRADRKAARRN